MCGGDEFMALLKCTNCGHDVSEYAEACPECGMSVSEMKKELETEILQCPECGSDVLETAEVCSNCGIPVSIIKEEMKNGVWCKINKRWKNITWIKERLLELDDDYYEHYKYIFYQEMLGKESADKCMKKYLFQKNLRKEDPLYKYYSNVYMSNARLRDDVEKKCNLSPYVTSSEFLYKLMESDFKLDFFEGKTYDDWNKEMVKRAEAAFAKMAPMVRCPYCKSTDVKKLSLTGKALSIGGLGILSNKIGKTYQCNNCKSTW